MYQADARSLVSLRPRMVTPPTDAAVDPLLKGPWSSAHSTGAESVVVPAIAVVAGSYVVKVTATQANTTFTLQVPVQFRITHPRLKICIISVQIQDADSRKFT